MPQYTFTASEEFIKGKVQEIADSQNRSLSEMINILLHQAVKERNRKKINALAKKDIHPLRNTNSSMEA